MNGRKYAVAIIMGIVLLASAGYFMSPKSMPRQPVTPAKTYTTLNEYVASIDTACQADSDCVIKDVRNCCGTYPQCVNAGAQVDPDFVRQACAKEGMASICGYPEIDSCKCVNGKCQGELKNELKGGTPQLPE